MTTPILSSPVDQPAFANAHFVTDQLAVGGDLPYGNDALVIRHVGELYDLGVTHVLDVRAEADDALIWDDVPDVDYRWDGIDDAGQRIPHTWFDRITSWALTALEDPDARLLTHCHMGINRGPSAGYAVLLAQGCDPVEAIAAIRAARPIAAVAYAEDALEWHLARTGANEVEARRARARLAAWRRDNHIDVVRIIRTIRRQERA
ncbi:hypothetical protein KLP28_13470 [Nocardioidaceae bacterium]|nr:hypothetical protein KLP28_13470 [Nocardioidaceae bacterium]